MIVSFRDRATADIYNGTDTQAGRRRLPRTLWAVARRRLDQMGRVTRLEQLAVPPGNRLESLRGSRDGEHSIRVNDQYRICFIWTEHGPDRVEITDYH